MTLISFNYQRLKIAFFSLLLVGCGGWHPSDTYKEFYSHLQVDLPISTSESDYFLVIMTSARHLDYTSCENLITTIQRHPDGSTTHDVGHAWIYLQGVLKGERVYVEGGHSGELGYRQARYFDGLMNYIEEGQKNPVKYLWATQYDGFFQEGSGGHAPTFAAKVDLTEEQFHKILTFIQPENYFYREYALRNHQCCSFVTQVAALAGIILESEVVISIPSTIQFGKCIYQLWQDPQFAQLTFGTPDLLEQSLIKQVVKGSMQKVAR